MKRYYVAITLVHTALFVPALAVGFFDSIVSYAPYLPEMLRVTTLGASFVFTLLQAITALVLLVRPTLSGNVLQGLTLGSIIAACMGIGTIVLVQGGLPLPGSTGFIWGAVVAGIWPGILRLISKTPDESASENSDEGSVPSPMVPVLVAVVVGLVSSILASTVFSPTPADEMATSVDLPSDPLHTNKTEPTPNTLNENYVVPVIQDDQSSLPEQTNESGDETPVTILKRFVGEWDHQIETPNGTAQGVSKTVQIADEPFLLSRLYETRELDVEADVDKIISLQAIWFDNQEKAFKLAQIQSGVPILISTGQWNSEEAQFEWEMRVDGKLFSSSTDRLANRGIQRTMTLYSNGQVVRSSTESLTPRHVNPRLPTLQTISQTDFKGYLGDWHYESFLTQNGEKKQVASGEVRVNSVGLEPVVLVRYYNDRHRLSEIQLMFSRGRKVSIPDGDRRVDFYVNGRDGKVRKWYFTNAGVEIDMLGEIDLESGTIEWLPKDKGQRFRGRDSLSQPGLGTIALDTLDDEGAVFVSFETQWKRKE
ncbi:MAG: hypothetical protein H6824_03520 [Planctomycetaceae bacterium]|nr:hypothetical protein [Planctomycetaceae bacterium]